MSGGPGTGTARRRRGFTLVEMLVVFTLVALCLSMLYNMFLTGQVRILAVNRRIEEGTAVRILLARIRQELRHSIAPVVIDNFEKNSLAIPLLDTNKAEDDPARRYYSKYTFDQADSSILFEKWPIDSLAQGQPLEQRWWLGGRTPVESFQIRHTSENERILFQYYQVIVDVAYYDVKIKDTARSAEEARDPENLIHVATMVYPRRINQELRIEIPQDGGYLN